MTWFPKPTSSPKSTTIATTSSMPCTTNLQDSKFGQPKAAQRQAVWTQPDQVFDEGNAFCKKITYKVDKKIAEEFIKALRTDPQSRISRDAQESANVAGGRKPRATTAEMIATGTDIRPLECVMFMRDVTRTQFRKSLMKPEGVLKGKSQVYYEQMKGQGTRIIIRDELYKVTPDATGKSRFVLVDCVGVTETKSLETKPSISTAKLMEQVARGDRHSDTLRALGNRMIRLDLKLNDQQRKRINELAGKPLALIAGELIHATNEADEVRLFH